MPSPQWIPNGGWRWSFLAEKSPCQRGIQWPRLADMATHVTAFSGCSSLLGSMGPRAHTKYLSQAVGAIMLRGFLTVSGEERVIFGQKSLCLRGVQWRIVCLQCHPNGQNFRLEWFVWIHETRGHVRHLELGDRGHAKCAMEPKQSLEGVLFGLKSPCLRGVPRHDLGLQCHSSGCNFWF